MAFNSLKAAMINAVCWTKLSTEREDAEVKKKETRAEEMLMSHKKV